MHLSSGRAPGWLPSALSSSSPGPCWTLQANSQAPLATTLVPPLPPSASALPSQPLSLRHPLSLALLPGPAGGAGEGRSESAAPTPPPFLSSCQTPDKAFSPSFPALNGLILSGSLGPCGASSPERECRPLLLPIPLPPAGSAPPWQPARTDHCLQFGFPSGIWDAERVGLAGPGRRGAWGR